MLVLIDLERLAFLYASQSAEALSCIDCIEARNSSTATIDAESVNYLDMQFTDLELKLLYKHTTGFDYNKYNRAELLQVVQDLALAIKPFEYNLAELRAQADYVEGQHRREGETPPYKYAPGLRVPAVQNDLYYLPSVAVPRNADAEATALQRAQARPKQVGPLVPAGGPAERERAPAGGSSTPRPVTAPRGGIRELIWRKADAMWEEAGKPTDTKLVLALRKKVMDALETDGIKRTSSSNELGNWQKLRLSA